ncbi:hypothetical protein, partial [Streptomyces sp. NPDC058695]|uniref:hypothetical protein n=1 Tax=Streptomyces sp. NPDC058695 TaxID=3346604 RepID=UPI003655E518
LGLFDPPGTPTGQFTPTRQSLLGATGADTVAVGAVVRGAASALETPIATASIAAKNVAPIM